MVHIILLKTLLFLLNLVFLKLILKYLNLLKLLSIESFMDKNCFLSFLINKLCLFIIIGTTYIEIF